MLTITPNTQKARKYQLPWGLPVTLGFTSDLGIYQLPWGWLPWGLPVTLGFTSDLGIYPFFHVPVSLP